jgi:hypothetical protein
MKLKAGLLFFLYLYLKVSLNWAYELLFFKFGGLVLFFFFFFFQFSGASSDGLPRFKAGPAIVLLDLDSVSGQIDILPKAPYLLSVSS